MMFPSKLVNFFLIAFGIVGLAVACAPAVTQAPTAPAVPATQAVPTAPVATQVAPKPVITELKVAMIAPRLASLPVFVAAEDFLSKDGIFVKWYYFQSDGPIAQALASGAVDMAVSNPIRAQQQNEAGGNVRLFSVNWATLDWLFIGNDKVQTLKDLPGKTVGISSPGSTTDLLFRLLLDRRGLSPEKDNIKIVAIGATEARAAALAAGRIDASWVGYDAAYDLLKKGNYRTVEDISVSKEFPGYMSTTWTAKKEYIDAHPDVVLAVAKAQILANRWAQDKKAFIDRAKTSIVGFIQVQSEEQVGWSFDQYKQTGIFPVNGGITRESIDATMDLAVKSKDIKAKPKFEDIAADEFQNKVLQQIGRQ